MARLSLFFLGPFSVTLDGEPVTNFETDKVRALLAYLAVKADRPHRRQELAGLLWPGLPERSARANLRNALSNLRQAIRDADAEPSFLLISRDTIQVNPAGDSWLDVTAYSELVEVDPADATSSQQLEQALALYRGPFLEGFSLRDSAEFDDWSLINRERLERQFSYTLGRVAEDCAESHEFERACDLARRRVEINPMDEQAHRQLMRLLALSDKRGEALAHYDSFRHLLATELGVEPTVETQEVHQLLLRGEIPPAPPAAVRVLEREPRVVGECPYRGLSAFREIDAPFFFGREAFTEQLVRAVQERPLVAVIVGSSGSGKSSAVFAGLLPWLRSEGAGTWLIAALRPGARPFFALSGALLNILEPELSETDRLIETRKLAQALSAREVSLFDVVERALAKSCGPTRLLILLDQFEELYTLCAEPELRRRFLETLLGAVEAAEGGRDSPLVLFLTLRADFMGQALAYRPFADALQESSLMLGPMTRDELRAAIEQPAEKQGSAFEAGLVERLLDDVGEAPGNLPLLEFALLLLWERLDQGWMTHAAYEQIGTVQGALAGYAESVFQSLDEDEQERARRVFLQLVQPGEGTQDTRRVALRTELGEENWTLVQHLADRRLVVTGRDPSRENDTVEVVHEALIQRWGQLRGWMEADRAFRSWQERLRAALRAWQASDQDEGGLLRGAPLAEAEGWRAERGSELGPDEVDFIRAGVALRERRQAERDLRRRHAILALAGGLIIALILVLLAGQQWLRAEDEVDARTAAQQQEAAQRVTAEANADARATAQVEAEAAEQEALLQASIGLASQALAELETDAPERGVLLALEALEHYPYTPQAERALAQTVYATRPYTDYSGLVQTLRAAAFSPDGRHLAAASSEYDAVIWDVATGEPTPIGNFYPNSDERVGHEGIAWSPNGDHYAVVTAFVDRMAVDGGLIKVWDASSGEQVAAWAGHDGESVWAVDWSDDDQFIVTAGGDGLVRMWRVADWEELRTFSGHNGEVRDLALAPDGGRLASAAADTTVRVWDVDSGEEVQVLSGHIDAVRAVDWSPDGSRVVSAGQDGVTIIWDVASGEIQQTLVGHTDAVVDVEWSPDGALIATSSADGTTRMWDAMSGTALSTLQGTSRCLTWSPAGDRLITGVGQSSMRMWDTSGRPLRLLGHQAPLTDGKWSPDGERIVTSSFDGTARVWDAASGENTLVYRNHQQEGANPVVGTINFAPDGIWVVTRGGDNKVRVWNRETGEDRYVYPFVGGHVFSPDGSRLAIVGDERAIVVDYATGDILLDFDPDFGGPCWFGRLSWSPDGRYFIGGCGFQPRADIWDAQTGEHVKTLPHVDAMVNTTDWSPDGKHILTAGEKGIVHIWDGESFEPLYDFEGHTSLIFDADWSPDGTRIASSDDSGIVRIWDAATRQEVNSYNVGFGVLDVNWSPDGTALISVGFQPIPDVRPVWPSTEALIEYAYECCVSRELTPEERVQFGLPLQ